MLRSQVGGRTTVLSVRVLACHDESTTPLTTLNSWRPDWATPHSYPRSLAATASVDSPRPPVWDDTLGQWRRERRSSLTRSQMHKERRDSQDNGDFDTGGDSDECGGWEDRSPVTGKHRSSLRHRSHTPPGDSRLQIPLPPGLTPHGVSSCQVLGIL